MSGDSKFFIGVLAIAILAVVGFVVFGKSSNSSGDIVDIDYSVGNKLGNDNAKVRIVEFGDIQCPACRAAAAPLRQAVEKNKDNVQLIFRNIPLVIHNNADEGAQAVEAADKQGKFWEMYDLLYAKQDEWSSLNDPLAQFQSYALALNIDSEKFTKDYKSSAVASIIQRDKKAADKYGVTSTPTFFVNGEKITGAQSLNDWQTIIDRKIAEAESAKQ